MMNNLEQPKVTQTVPLDTDDLLTPEAAASLLQLSPRTLASWRSQGRNELPWYRVGSRIRYRRADLLAWLEARKAATGADDLPGVA